MHFTNAFIRGKKPPFRGVFKYKDKDGEWRQTVRTLKAQGISEAKRELAEMRIALEEEHERKAEVAKATMTVDEYLESYISDLDRSRSLERSTINGYRCYAKNVSNGLGRIRLSELNAAQVRAWEAKLLKDGLSGTTVRKAHVLLKSACEQAVQADLIPRNPLAAVRPPKAEDPMPNALSERTRRALLTYLDAAADTPFNLAVLMALSTGMREGELCGLRWADVDLKSRTLWVRRSVARDNGKYYVKPPKTRTSVRNIPLTLALAKKLKARKDAQETELIVAGLEPSEERMS
jgi:integrase